jgi:hypothetical protein
VLKLEVSYKSYNNILKDFGLDFCMVNYLSFHKFSFALSQVLNVNGKATM